MFDNIGGKIKKLAEIICGLGIVASIISGIVVMAIDEDMILIGLLIIALGCLLSWIGSFFTYGFGEIIEKLCEIENNTRTEKSNSVYQSVSQPVQATANCTNAVIRRWKCSKCGNIIDTEPCPICSKKSDGSNAVKVSADDEGSVTCPICNTKQNGNRRICWNCGKRFITDEDISI